MNDKYKMTKASKEIIKEELTPLFSDKEQAEIKEISKNLKESTEKYIKYVETPEGKA